MRQGVAPKERLCSANIHAQKHCDGTFSYWKYFPHLLILHEGTEWLVLVLFEPRQVEDSYFQDKFTPPKNKKKTKNIFKVISYGASCTWKVWQSPQNICGASEGNSLGDSKMGTCFNICVDNILTSRSPEIPNRFEKMLFTRVLKPEIFTVAGKQIVLACTVSWWAHGPACTSVV